MWVGREARVPVSEIDRLLGVQTDVLVVLYARVSGHGQRADLERQIEVLERWARAERPKATTRVISEVGSGLNANRRGLARVLRMVGERQVGEVVVTYRDRLTRFGQTYLETYFSAFGVRLTVLETAEDAGPERELAEDLISIVASFSGRLYGERSRKQRELIRCAKTTLNS
jgi:predicted site-specific integrase-resolvase